MIAPRKIPATFQRTLQRLDEAEFLIEAGHPTAAIIMLRTALDAAPREAIGFPLEGKAFVTIVAVQAGCSRRLVNRVRNLRGNANGVVHGAADGRDWNARAMLRLFRIVGTRWLRRIHGVTIEPATRPSVFPEKSKERVSY